MGGLKKGPSGAPRQAPILTSGGPLPGPQYGSVGHLCGGDALVQVIFFSERFQTQTLFSSAAKNRKCPEVKNFSRENLSQFNLYARNE